MPVVPRTDRPARRSSPRSTSRWARRAGVTGAAVAGLLGLGLLGGCTGSTAEILQVTSVEAGRFCTRGTSTGRTDCFTIGDPTVGPDTLHVGECIQLEFHGTDPAAGRGDVLAVGCPVGTGPPPTT